VAGRFVLILAAMAWSTLRPREIPNFPNRLRILTDLNCGYRRLASHSVSPMPDFVLIAEAFLFDAVATILGQRDLRTAPCLAPPTAEETRRRLLTIMDTYNAEVTALCLAISAKLDHPVIADLARTRFKDAELITSHTQTVLVYTGTEVPCTREIAALYKLVRFQSTCAEYVKGFRTRDGAVVVKKIKELGAPMADMLSALWAKAQGIQRKRLATQ